MSNLQKEWRGLDPFQAVLLEQGVCQFRLRPVYAKAKIPDNLSVGISTSQMTIAIIDRMRLVAGDLSGCKVLQGKLADAIGISAPQYSNFIAHRAAPGRDFNAADALGRAVHWVIHGGSRDADYQGKNATERRIVNYFFPKQFLKSEWGFPYFRRPRHHWNTFYDRPEFVNFLNWLGRNPMARDKRDGLPAVRIAIFLGSEELARSLLADGDVGACLSTIAAQGPDLRVRLVIPSRLASEAEQWNVFHGQPKIARERLDAPRMTEGSAAHVKWVSAEPDLDELFSPFHSSFYFSFVEHDGKRVNRLIFLRTLGGDSESTHLSFIATLREASAFEERLKGRGLID